MTKWEYDSEFVKLLDNDAINRVNEEISDAGWEIYQLYHFRSSEAGRIYFKRSIDDTLTKEKIAYDQGYHDAKHFYFNVQKTIEHWKHVVEDDGPKGVEYAKLIHQHLHTVLRGEDDD